MSLSTLWAWLMYGWAAGEILLAVFVRARGGRTNIQDRGTQFILWGVIFGSIFATEWVGHVFPGSIPASIPSCVILLTLGWRFAFWPWACIPETGLAWH